MENSCTIQKRQEPSEPSDQVTKTIKYIKVVGQQMELIYAIVIGKLEVTKSEAMILQCMVVNYMYVFFYWFLLFFLFM
jgi:hypothetical protein